MLFRAFFFLSALTSLILANGESVGEDVAEPPFIQTDSLVIARVKDTNSFLAYSESVGKWNTFTFPEGVNSKPVYGKGVCAFYAEGENITELVAVDLQGNWCTLTLTVPVKKCTPFMSDKVAGFIVNDRVYAFSGEHGKWDSVNGSVVPNLTSDTALILTSDSIAVFSSATAKWAVARITR